jgi:acylpyruvate hydrolase
MRLVSWDRGFGRLSDDGASVVPMGASLVEWLTTGDADDGAPIARDDVRLTAPVARPQKVVCIGVNYREHAAEMGRVDLPSVPTVFAKWANAVIGPEDDVLVPPGVDLVDYEAELAVVIGRRASRVARGDALDHVAGYCCANDVSSRQRQYETTQWTMGKAVDTFLPLGPHLVTADEIPDPQQLAITCTVNGEVRQSSTTAQMIFPVAELIEFVSSMVTLEPGDVISTGTPPGVGAGMKPPRFLSDGDEVVVDIEGVGALRSTIRTEPPS